MKISVFISLSILSLCYKVSACASYNPDWSYFNLFAQEIVQNPEYQPFFMTMEASFYDDVWGSEKAEIKDENIEAWQNYFNDELSYDETNALLKIIALKHLNEWQKGNLTHQLSKKFGANFYAKYSEGMEYIRLAKRLEPFMKFNHENGGSSWYNEDEKILNAGDLPFEKTLKELKTAYNNSNDTKIKERYAFQIIRFLHYTRNYNDAVMAFNNYFSTEGSSPIYWQAVNQVAGAMRGMGDINKANYLFFKVFKNSKNWKKSAYISMTLQDENDLKNLLNNAKTNEEKNMVYFLLAYNNFSNPVPQMEKMLAIDNNSEILKVLTARAINYLERDYLPVTLFCYDNYCTEHQERKLPIAYHQFNDYSFNGYGFTDYIKSLENVVNEAADANQDAFWDLAKAYLKFLQKEYKNSSQILHKISTKNQVYKDQIAKLLMLNDIVSHPVIDKKFEQHLITKYASFFTKEKDENYAAPTTLNFVKDILANRYFLQNDKAKSFLIHNQVSDVQWVPNLELVKDLEKFYFKENKTDFENYIAKDLQYDLETNKKVKSFFELIYGDFAMRSGDFNKAIEHYSAVTDFNGIPRYNWDSEALQYSQSDYNGFDNISSYVFGFNQKECFNCSKDFTMKLTENANLGITKNQLFNKLELAKKLNELSQIATTQQPMASVANQWLGNFFYNTTALGFYRHLFVLDVNNQNSPKYHFKPYQQEFKYYFKTYSYLPKAELGDFDLAIDFYQKALQQSDNKENQAQILFQMASAEQGKYYLWEAEQTLESNWQDDDYEQKRDDFQLMLDNKKNAEFRTYFDRLNAEFADTQTFTDLRKSCSYFNYFVSQS